MLLSFTRYWKTPWKEFSLALGITTGYLQALIQSLLCIIYIIIRLLIRVQKYKCQQSSKNYTNNFLNNTSYQKANKNNLGRMIGFKKRNNTNSFFPFGFSILCSDFGKNFICNFILLF